MFDFNEEYNVNRDSNPSVTSTSVSEATFRDGSEALKTTLSECLHSSCKPLIYIAPIPCGAGKSRTVQEFIAGWKDDGFPGAGSIIIMLSTLAEIDAYIGGCKLASTDYACLSPREQYSRYGLGRAKAGEAKVLFVTHEQMRRKVIAAGSFEAITEFHFHRRARTLRICDEGILPAVPVSIRLSTLETLPDAIGGKLPDLARKIDNLRLDRQDRVTGRRILIPADIGEEAFKLAYGGKDWLSAEHLKALEMLGYLSGHSAVLMKDNRFGSAGGLCLVGSSSPLPDDLAPCIIMDASAGLRHSYRSWASRTSTVKFLPAQQVSYRNLDIQWWNTGAGKSVLEKLSSREAIIGAITAKINETPSERWLVIHPKNVSGCFIVDDLKRDLNQENAMFLHWGLHLGSNEYRNIKNVIIIGSNDYGQIALAAHHHAATSGSEASSSEAIHRHADGEFAHHVYQAACRSNLRNIVEGVAGDAAVYLITKQAGGRKDSLLEAFPDCNINDWCPVPPKPKRVEERFRGVVCSLFSDGRVTVTTKEIWQACEAKSAAYIQRLWKRESVQQFLLSQEICRKGNSLHKVARPTVK